MVVNTKSDERASTDEKSVSAAATKSRPWLVLVILSITGFIIMYVETMLAPAIPDLVRDFHVSYSSVSWVLSSYMIAAAVSTPILGRLSDHYGRKKVLVIGLSVYAGAVLASGFATNISFMIATRIIQGIGIGIFPTAVAIIREEFSREKIGVAQGIITSMFAGGATVGLALGGIIIDNLGWRATFFTVVPVPVLLVVLITVLIKRKEVSARANGKTFSLDLKGVLTLSVSISAFIAALNYLSNSKDSVTVYALIAIGVISSTLFVIMERKVRLPLVEPKLLFDKILFASNLLRMSSGIIIFMLLQTIPVLVRSPKPLGFGGTASSAAFVTLPMTMTYLAVGLSVGFVLYRIGNVKVSALGGIIGLAGFSLLYLNNVDGLPLILVLIGAAAQLMHLGGTNLNLVSSPKEHTGISFGISNVFYLTACALGPALAAVFMEENLMTIPHLGRFPSPESYHMIFAAGIAISLIATIVSLWAMKSKRSGLVGFKSLKSN